MHGNDCTVASCIDAATVMLFSLVAASATIRHLYFEGYTGLFGHILAVFL